MNGHARLLLSRFTMVMGFRPMVMQDLVWTTNVLNLNLGKGMKKTPRRMIRLSSSDRRKTLNSTFIKKITKITISTFQSRRVEETE